MPGCTAERQVIFMKAYNTPYLFVVMAEDAEVIRTSVIYSEFGDVPEDEFVVR